MDIDDCVVVFIKLKYIKKLSQEGVKKYYCRRASCIQTTIIYINFRRKKKDYYNIYYY